MRLGDLDPGKACDESLTQLLAAKPCSSCGPAQRPSRSQEGTHCYQSTAWGGQALGRLWVIAWPPTFVPGLE